MRFFTPDVADSPTPGGAEWRPVVSILIPVYNTEPYLRRCLDSALGQTLKDIEIVCVDDGSTDGCAAILAEYAVQDPRLRVISQKNHGPLHARSEAARSAKGEYFLCLDADDTFRPGIVERAVAAARHHLVDVVEFGIAAWEHGFFLFRRRQRWGIPNPRRMGRILRQPTLAEEALRHGLHGSLVSKLVRREIFLAADGDIPPEVRAVKFLSHDDELFCVLLLCRARTYTAIPDIGCDYAIRPLSLTWQKKNDFSKHLAIMDEFSLSLRTLYKILPPSLHRYLFEGHVHIAVAYSCDWKCFTRAQRLQTWQWLADSFHFNGTAHAHFLSRVFGRKEVLRLVTRNLLRHRPLTLRLKEWAKRLLRRDGRFC